MVNPIVTDTAPTALPEYLSIDQFCGRYGFTKAYYFRLRERGQGPAEVRIGTKLVRIRQEAVIEWEKANTQKVEPPAANPATKKPVK